MMKQGQGKQGVVQAITDQQMYKAIEAIVVAYCEQRVAEVGDKFATATELESIKTDPIGWLDLMKGYDAYDVLHCAWRKTYNPVPCA